MAEIDAIKLSIAGPVTIENMIEDLKQIGITPGMALLVHSSMSSLGWVCGGPVAVIHALQATVGSEGTLIMPTHSTGLSDPKGWENPPVDPTWWDTIRNTMPAFHPDITPTRGMGGIPEYFRTFPDVVRSCHPQVSFAAWGKNADFIVNNHSLESSLGETSPLARIYGLSGSILSIGVGYDTNTSLHLAEYRADYPAKTFKNFGAPIIENGQRKWVIFNDLDISADDFLDIGKAYEEETCKFTKDQVGYAQSILVPQRDLVDFAVQWIEKNRT